MWWIGFGTAGVAVLVLAMLMVVAVLAGVRLFLAGRRAAGVLGLLGAGLLGAAAFLMPFELAVFAAMDNGRNPVELVEDIFDEEWFLVAWGVLMLMAAVPAALNTAALWLAVPRRSDGADPPVEAAPSEVDC